ncbi:MAG: hypothetical protein HQK66_11810 [Desulfamplus sp.]|nr:hypothetical protein [Desulfamplus sp.]
MVQSVGADSISAPRNGRVWNLPLQSPEFSASSKSSHEARFSFAANEEQNAVGEILDESFEVTAMDSSAKEFLSAAIADYNATFNGDSRILTGYSRRQTRKTSPSSSRKYLFKNANKKKHIRRMNGRLRLSTPEIITPLEIMEE